MTRQSESVEVTVATRQQEMAMIVGALEVEIMDPEAIANEIAARL